MLLSEKIRYFNISKSIDLQHYDMRNMRIVRGVLWIGLHGQHAIAEGNILQLSAFILNKQYTHIHTYIHNDDEISN